MLHTLHEMKILGGWVGGGGGGKLSYLSNDMPHLQKQSTTSWNLVLKFYS